MHDSFLLSGSVSRVWVKESMTHFLSVLASSSLAACYSLTLPWNSVETFRNRPSGLNQQHQPAKVLEFKEKTNAQWMVISNVFLLAYSFNAFFYQLLFYKVLE